MNRIFSNKENKFVGATNAELSIGEIIIQNEVTYKVVDIIRVSGKFGTYYDLPIWRISDTKTYVIDEL